MFPTPKKEEEICQDVNSDYQWYKLCVHLLLLLLLSIFQFPTRQSEILSIRIYFLKKTKNINFLLKVELAAHLIATQALTPVLWRPERVCHVHDQIGRLWAALSTARQACPGWYGRRSIIQVSHHRRCQAYDIATHCTWTISHNPACCQASEPYLPKPLFLPCPVNVRGTDWDCLTPSEDTVDQETKADARLPLKSKADAQMLPPF